MNNIITFDKSLLEKARQLFYKVYVDNFSGDGVYYIGSETANQGIRVRIYYTEWEYADEIIVYTNEELGKIVNDELSVRAWELQHE